MSIRDRIRSLVGDRLFFSLGYYALLRQPAFRASLARLEQYRDRHRGQRCVIIGNGPSLKRMDLAPLRDEITFGLNRIYLLFDELGFATTYHVAVNKLVVEQFAADILASVPGPTFIGYDSRRWMPFTDNVIFVYSREGPRFFGDVTRGVWQGATVTYVAMQLAYFMGFAEVILIGVDHSFAAQGRPHQTVISEGDDASHFDPRYFGQGVRWQLPDLALSELAYRMAREHYEANGRRILDATVGGQLQVFPKVDYRAVFSLADG